MRARAAWWCRRGCAWTDRRRPAPEHFQEKWNPVFRPKMRPRKKARVLSVSMETERTLAAGWVSQPNGYLAGLRSPDPDIRGGPADPGSPRAPFMPGLAEPAIGAGETHPHGAA